MRSMKKLVVVFISALLVACGGGGGSNSATGSSDQQQLQQPADNPTAPATPTTPSNPGDPTTPTTPSDQNATTPPTSSVTEPPTDSVTPPAPPKSLFEDPSQLVGRTYFHYGEYGPGRTSQLNLYFRVDACGASACQATIVWSVFDRFENLDNAGTVHVSTPVTIGENTLLLFRTEGNAQLLGVYLMEGATLEHPVAFWEDEFPGQEYFEVKRIVFDLVDRPLPQW